MPSVKKLQMSGASEVVFRDYKGKDLDLELSGASSFKYAGNAKHIKINATGASRSRRL